MGKKIEVFINDDLVPNNSTYSYCPNYIDIKVSLGSKVYSVLEGEYTIAFDYGKVIKVLPFDSLNYKEQFKLLQLPAGFHGKKIVVQFKNIFDRAMNAKINFEKYIYFVIDPQCEPKLDPYFDILVNGKVGIDRTGIVIDSIKSIKVVSDGRIFNDTIFVTCVRGIKGIKYKLLLRDLEQLDANKIPFKNGQAGDRFLFEFVDDKNNKKLFNLPIN